MTDLMLRDPFAALEDPLTNMRRAMDRLGAATFWRRPELFVEESHLALDIREEDGKYVVEASMPGFTKDQIDVEVSQGVLTINAERKVEEERKRAHYHYRERYQGAVSRRVELPGIAADVAVDATLKDGVLTLILPIVEGARTRRVAIAEA